MAELSLFSNLVWVHQGTDAEARLYELILAALKNHETEIGKWEIVWGPAVEVPGFLFFPINAMYAVRSIDQPKRYVVAIAGTDPLSLFDWFIEDFLVTVQLPWSFAPSAGSISLGTATGLSILLGSKPSGDRPSAGLRLVDFLARLPDKNIDLTFTGYSLGGALAPVLALALRDMRPSWDPRNQVHYSAATTAAPTPGNVHFASYVDHHLAVTRFWNSLDVVPHAWNQTLLDQLPTLYAPEIPEDLAVDIIVGMAKGAALIGDYGQIRPNTPPFEGTIDASLIDRCEPALFNFLVQMVYQHVIAYIDYFGITGAEADSITKALFSIDAIRSMLPRLARRARIPISRSLRRFAQAPSRAIAVDPDALARKVRTELREFAHLAQPV